MTGTWPSGWQVGDVEIAAQYGKGIGAIFDTTLGGSAANIDITGIVGTYAHLMILLYARGDAVATTTTTNVRLNGDSGANYDYQYIQAQTSTVNAAELFGQTSGFVAPVPAASAGANLFGACAIFIPNYASSSNNKALAGVSCAKIGTTGGSSNFGVNVIGCFWRSSAAITRVTLLPATGNFVAGTRASVYAMGA